MTEGCFQRLLSEQTLLWSDWLRLVLRWKALVEAWGFEALEMASCHVDFSAGQRNVEEDEAQRDPAWGVGVFQCGFVI